MRGESRLLVSMNTRLPGSERQDLADPQKATALFSLVANELVKRESPFLPIVDRNRIVDWMIRDPYFREQATAYLAKVLWK
jgi:hypothetical protein